MKIKRVKSQAESGLSIEQTVPGNLYEVVPPMRIFPNPLIRIADLAAEGAGSEYRNRFLDVVTGNIRMPSKTIRFRPLVGWVTLIEEDHDV